MDKKKAVFTKGHFNLEEVIQKAKQNPFILVDYDEQEYHHQINTIVDDIVNNRQDVKLILLSGPSSAGKTTSSNLIEKGLRQHGFITHVVSQDNFFVEAARTPLLPDGSYDFENVACIDMEEFNRFLHELETQKVANMPIFDFVKKRRKDEYLPLEVGDHSIIIMEGIHALNPILTQGFNGKTIAKVYIDPNSDYYFHNKLFLQAQTVRLMRRSLRDYYTRGHSITSTLDMWKNVCDGEEIFIKPFKQTADYLLDSSHSYEILLYANYLKPLLEQSFHHPKAKQLLEKLNQCPILDSSWVPSNSLMQEFLAGN